GAATPSGCEKVAAAIRDDRSNFARIRLPVELAGRGESYFGNLCIHRGRLPSGYVHDRLLPILIAPKETHWCCILPLRCWPAALKERWQSGPPAHEPSAFTAMMGLYNVKP